MSDSAAVVRELSPVANLNQFFADMFGTQVGYVYAPIKETKLREGEEAYRFKRRFFAWPAEAEKLITHVLSATGDHEVYFSPALWNEVPDKDTKLSESFFKGTYHVWVDLDYGLPTEEQMKDIPEPTLRIQSSTSGKEHWYWRLDFFEDRKEILELFTKRLTYALDADPSGWDYTQVLRPPGTINHKRDNRKVTQQNVYSRRTISVDTLMSLPEVPTNTGLIDARIDILDLPAFNDVVFKYAWPEDAAALVRKKVTDLNIKKGQTKPDRSEAEMRLAYECAEMGMTNPEMYVILEYVDKRWGKFIYTQDPHAAYVKMINRARAKHPLNLLGGVEEEIPIFGFKDFLDADVYIEWIIRGLLQKAGLFVLSSPPGVGKTQISIWIAMHLCLGKPVFGWDVERPIKIMFYSMEMGHADLKHIVAQLVETLGFTDEEMLILQENLIILPMGYSILLSQPANQQIILQHMERFKPDGVMFDSLGVSIGEDINKDTVINGTFDFLNKYIRTRYGCFVWFLHHNRKAQVNNAQPKHLSDLYGSQYIGSHANTVIGLWPVGGRIQVNSLKSRLDKEFQSFKITRTTEPLGFTQDNVIVIERTKQLEITAGDNGDEDTTPPVDFGLA